MFSPRIIPDLRRPGLVEFRTGMGVSYKSAKNLFILVPISLPLLSSASTRAHRVAPAEKHSSKNRA